MTAVVSHPHRAVWNEPESPYIGVDRQNSRLVGGGSDLLLVVCLASREAQYFSIPASRQPDGLAERFARLAAQWRSETAMLSSVTEMAMHPAYQAIIGLGPEVVPLLIRDLAGQPSHWFWALKAITGIDPVAPADRGNVKKMIDAWLEWGTEQGYLPQ